MKNVDLENAWGKTSFPTVRERSKVQVYKRCTGGEMRMMSVHMPPKRASDNHTKFIQ
jgi:hypothetical protein